MCRLAVVKLGGSVVTRKNEPEKVDMENIDRCAETLRDYIARGGKLVLILGGGSFGHYTVAKILESKGRLEVADSSPIQLSMLKLVLIVASKLQEKGVPVVVHPPHTICRAGDSKSCDASIIARDLAIGLTPLLFGDAIPSRDGVSIVSGDDLASTLAQALGADCLIYVTSAPGVLSQDGRVLPLVRKLSDVKIIESTGVDVTGGILRKIERALEASVSINNVRIVGLNDLKEALEGLSVGTRIEIER